jgi:hypothetical protein
MDWSIELPMFRYLLFILFLSNCSTENDTKKIDLTSISPWRPTLEHTSIQLVKTFSNKSSCFAGHLNANVYVTLVENDTLFVFDLCQQVPDYAREGYEYKDDLDIVIEKEKVVKDSIKELFVSAEFFWNRRSRYIIAPLTRLEY